MNPIQYRDIEDPDFRHAVKAIDAGDIAHLSDLLKRNPNLINEKVHFPGAGYFENPYLIYFVADNPIRNEKLPENILEVLKLLIESLLHYPTQDKQKQLDYTLGLVATGRISKESGKQIAIIDLLLDAGATPGNGVAALAHGNIDAAKYLIRRGGTLTLVTAAFFEELEVFKKMISNSSNEDVLVGLAAAAYYGKAEIISILLSNGANPNGYPTGFHTHATPLHQAVYSGSLECVKLLIDAGANRNAIDKVHEGTPLGWAKYMQSEASITENDMKKYGLIAAFLENRV